MFTSAFEEALHQATSFERHESRALASADADGMVILRGARPPSDSALAEERHTVGGTWARTAALVPTLKPVAAARQRANQRGYAYKAQCEELYVRRAESSREREKDEKRTQKRGIEEERRDANMLNLCIEIRSQPCVSIASV